MTLFKCYIFKRQIAFALIYALGLMTLVTSAQAQKIENPVAVFSALDKITAVVTTIEVPIDQTVKFGTLNVTPPTEPPSTTAFVEVDEVRLDGAKKRIFTGWMFASSPGLNGVEHPVYDVWLINCKTASDPASIAKEKKSP